MKKVLLGLVINFMLSVATCFAAPFNTLEPGKTAMGLVYWGASDPNYVTITYDDWNMAGLYLEHKFSDKLTMGLESMGRSDYYIDYPHSATVDSYLTDLYLQYHINDNSRLLLGNKFFNQDMYGTSYGYYTDSKPYIGVAFTSNLSDRVEGYAALTTADIQVGTNLNFSENFSGNIFYRTCSIKGLDLSGIGFGLTLKFNTKFKVITIEEWDKKDNPKEEGKDKKNSPKKDDGNKKGKPKEKTRGKKGGLKKEDRGQKGSPKEEEKDKKDNPQEDDPKEKDRDKKDKPRKEDNDKKVKQIEEGSEAASPTN